MNRARESAPSAVLDPLYTRGHLRGQRYASCQSPAQGSTRAGGRRSAPDAVILNSVTSHKASPYGTDSLRLSLDVHYQLTSEAVGPAAPLPENPRPDLAGDSPALARSGSLKYSWRRFDLTVKEYDWSSTDRHEPKAIEMAKEGDINARPTVTRMMIRSPDPERRRIAPSGSRNWTRATEVLLPELEGSEPGPSSLESPNQTLAAARSSAPTNHALP
jgi:hypothetical protein